MKKFARRSLILFALITATGIFSLVLAQKPSLKFAFEKAALAGWSGVVLVAEEGKPFFYMATGFRHFETKTRLKKTDVFELASVSKQFTAMVIMQLCQQGKLTIDDSLSKYVRLPYPGITIRHLLTHTSGLPDYQAIMDEHWDKQQVATNPDIIAYLNRYAPPALFNPGEKYLYSNTGYVLLATIAEVASGKDFVALCNQQIFNPLRMEATNIRNNTEKALVKNFAAGHLKNDAGNYVNANQFHASDYTVWLGGRKGPGRVSSTARDLLKWDNAFYGETLVNDSLLQAAFTPFVLNNGKATQYGFGWVIKEYPVLGKYVMHTGDNPGYQTLIMRFIEKRKTIIVLNNNAHNAMQPMVDEMIAAIANM